MKEVLKTFGMSDCKPVGTPIVIGCKLSKEDEATFVDEKEYRSMIGILHYVVHNRLDTTHAVGLVAIFKKNPKETHLIETKRIFKFLKGIIDYELWYPYEGNFDDSKSTTDGAFFLGGRLVSWSSKK